MASYDKDHLTFEEQIKLLESRGLVVADRAAAATALSMIGYYRFSAYTHLFRIPLRPSARGHDQRLSEFLDRSTAELSPIEHGILCIAAYELIHDMSIPYRVVINEGVELAKSYGGTDGYKYVNGVLDKLAAAARPDEFTRRSQR